MAGDPAGAPAIMPGLPCFPVPRGGQEAGSGSAAVSIDQGAVVFGSATPYIGWNE